MRLGKQLTKSIARKHGIDLPKEPSKNGNVKVVIDGITFDSKREGRHYQQLKLAEKAGKIRDLKLQVGFVIEFEGRPVLMKSNHYKNGRKLRYVADFVYTDCSTGLQMIIDSKGERKDVYKIKKALMEHMGYTVTEW